VEQWQILAVMFVTLGVFIAAGVPIFVAFGITNAIMLVTFVGGLPALTALALSSYSSVATFDFTALPMFLLMGSIVLYAGLASQAVIAMGKWLGRMPGRLAVLSVVSGTVLGGASGSSMADTATLGMILLPEMRKRGYDKHLAVGCLATCGALAVLIPPSGLMVIMAGISRLRGSCSPRQCSSTSWCWRSSDRRWLPPTTWKSCRGRIGSFPSSTSVRCSR
jgi:TRAP-type mannitol/chloroaromatic compound transport system permease large subunit